MTEEMTVLVFQGGGALGSYQAGAYEALAQSGQDPDWVAGISIGAINAALIAGNPPGQRVAALREFWQRISSGVLGMPWWPGTAARALFNETSAVRAVGLGVPGFYRPRLPPPWLQSAGTPEALSWYDTTPLHDTLESLIDVDRMNNGVVRLSVEAVNVKTGNAVVFDSEHQRIELEHVLASGALPPAFAPVEINGQHFWDGGLVSNMPLKYVLDGENRQGPQQDMAVFQVDLFSARGPAPKNLLDVEQRVKDIRFSSRTRLNTERFAEMQTVRAAARRLFDQLPATLKDDPDAQLFDKMGCEAVVDIALLINRRTAYARQSKDYEFSRLSVEEHWQSGIEDVQCTLSDARWQNRARPATGVAVFDLCRAPGQARLPVS